MPLRPCIEQYGRHEYESCTPKCLENLKTQTLTLEFANLLKIPSNEPKQAQSLRSNPINITKFKPTDL